MSELQIEAGKYYRRRDGKVVGPARTASDQEVSDGYPWNVGGQVYTTDGRFWRIKRTDDRDLVAEANCSEPQPGEWWEVGSNKKFGIFVGWDRERFAVFQMAYSKFEPWHSSRLKRHLPDCTGFDYEIPPEKTPAEKQLEEFGVHFDPDKANVAWMYCINDGSIGVGRFSPKQLRAIADHMEEIKATA